MTYKEMFTEVRRLCRNVDASQEKEHIAVQFNVTGRAEGVFYMEVRDGVLHIEPYDYYDRDGAITAPAETILDVLYGKMSITFAVENFAYIEGNMVKIRKLRDIVLKQ